MSNSKSINKTILSEIKSGQLKMRPRWYFILGSFLSFVSLVTISLVVIFLVNLILFSLDHQQFFSSPRFSLLISSVPLYLPILAILGLALGTFLLKRYDFSYRHKPTYLAIIIILAVLLGSYLFNKSGLNDYLSTQTPMRTLYEELGITPGNRQSGSSSQGQGSSQGSAQGQGQGKGAVQGVKHYGRLN
jgi:hypothetical protein